MHVFVMRYDCTIYFKYRLPFPTSEKAANTSCITLHLTNQFGNAISYRALSPAYLKSPNLASFILTIRQYNIWSKNVEIGMSFKETFVLF